MAHHHEDLFENRKQFQLERLILFSDAVFAIAITLLVIEIRVPEIHNSNNFNADLLHALEEKIPEFFGFFLSFAVIGQFWVSHHRLFGYVKSYNGRLLWLNLHMLFWIVLVPFSSSLNSRYGGSDFVWMCYSFNMLMIGLALYFIWKYIGNPKNNLSAISFDKRIRKMSSTRSLIIALIFLMAIVLCIPGIKALSLAARFIFFAIPIAMVFISRHFKEKK